MKTNCINTIIGFFFILALSVSQRAAAQTGRVVINEYLPWPSNACGSTSEFVELLNFGPGPIDIGCYVLTNGKYSITVPPHTVLSPGQFYVISGQDFLPSGCGNIASATTVNLNWNSCNCTNIPIPTTGDGLMADGGGGNVNLVLLDPDQNIVDAVTRQLPVPASSTITSSSVSGGCNPLTFNLDQLSVNYETLGMSTGNANSFARKLDGDCGWVKDPQQSAGATNNTPGSVSDVSYGFSIVNSMDCNNLGGRVQIFVKHDNVSSLFPMQYTVAFDSDNNGSFDFTDSYSYGTDNTPPDIIIDNLPAGHFRVTVSSTNGCYLRTFEFSILRCEPVLPTRLNYFRKAGPGKIEWQLTDAEYVNDLTVEYSSDAISFIKTTGYRNEGSWRSTLNFSAGAPQAGYYRLRIQLKNGDFLYSPVLNLSEKSLNATISPNPASDQAVLSLNAAVSGASRFSVYNGSGALVKCGNIVLRGGSADISLSDLQSGVYLLRVDNAPGMRQPICLRFVKQ